jgi:RNA polymerase sigma factor (sigma-70 family)
MNMMAEESLAHEDPNGSEQLYRSEHPRVVRLCRLLLMNPQDAEEVAQEVFLRLVREQAANHAIVSWKAWLTRVAVNACHDRKRSAWWKLWNRSRSSDGAEIDMTFPADTGTPEEHLLSRERQKQLWRTFGALSPRQREVFVLRRLEGLSTEEAAMMLGLTTGSIKRHLFHAMHNLQKALGES